MNLFGAFERAFKAATGGPKRGSVTSDDVEFGLVYIDFSRRGQRVFTTESYTTHNGAFNVDRASNGEILGIEYIAGDFTGIDLTEQDHDEWGSRRGL